MSGPVLRLAEARQVERRQPKLPLGRLLVDMGLLSASDLILSLKKQRDSSAHLGDIVIADGLVAEDDLLNALARQQQLTHIQLNVDPPAVELSHLFSAEFCQRHLAIPWRRFGKTLFVAVADPQSFEELQNEPECAGLWILPVLANRKDIISQITRLYGPYLAEKAARRAPLELSARRWTTTASRRRSIAGLLLCGLLLYVLLAPFSAQLTLLGWCVLTLTATLFVKVAAFCAEMLKRVLDDRPKDPVLPACLPKVSVMVPLYREKEIANALIKRLEKLTYPKHLLEVLLVLEAKDQLTWETLARTDLPTWMTVIKVPDDGSITTKPRALNYAFDFCQGEIVGVWDAEDAPEPRQIEKVVSRFAKAPANVACLQGMLDYYNARSNWIARCFTIEYATWWRIIMPGMASIGFIIPLGGTTLFFRRHVLEDLGLWDAHNVTEDADLGVRLARAGYVTDILPTVTMEEANCRALPWIRQRSRWLKGFMITYLVHMRQPLQLLADVGLQRFLGLQIIFLATFSQFAALPLLWLFWMPATGFPAAFSAMFGWQAHALLATLFLTAEFMNCLIGMVAVSGSRHRHLLVWVLTMPIYFTLGAVAAYKALFEMIMTPFYWDKTHHGVFKAETP